MYIHVGATYIAIAHLYKYALNYIVEIIKSKKSCIPDNYGDPPEGSRPSGQHDRIAGYDRAHHRQHFPGGQRHASKLEGTLTRSAVKGRTKIRETGGVEVLEKYEEEVGGGVEEGSF